MELALCVKRSLYRRMAAQSYSAAGENNLVPKCVLCVPELQPGPSICQGIITVSVDRSNSARPTLDLVRSPRSDVGETHFWTAYWLLHVWWLVQNYSVSVLSHLSRVPFGTIVDVKIIEGNSTELTIFFCFLTPQLKLAPCIEYWWLKTSKIHVLTTIWISKQGRNQWVTWKLECLPN